MTINMFRYIHFSEEALGKPFENLLQNSDILLVESVAKEDYEHAKKFYNDISSKGYNNHRLYYQDLGGFEHTFNSMIRGWGGRVEVEKSPITLKEAERWEDMNEETTEAFFSGRFDEAYEKGLKESRYFLEMNEKRDGQLEEQLIELQDQNPEKTILFPVGGGHLIYMNLKKRGVDAKQTLGYKTLIFDSRSEFMRRTMLRFESPPELIGRIFTDDIIFTYLHKMGTPLFECSDRTRRASDKMSLEMLKELSEHIGSDATRKRYPVEASVLWLKKNGIEV